MTKKKIFSKLALAMMMATACTGFTSCGDDNDEPEAPATWGSSYVVTFELNDDVINTADITRWRLCHGQILRRGRHNTASACRL